MAENETPDAPANDTTPPADGSAPDAKGPSEGDGA